MKKLLWILTGIFLAHMQACSQEGSAKQEGGAKVELKDAQGRVVGNGVFREHEGAVRLSLRVRGLSPGEHGIHIHENGKCEPPNFESAGSHYNPASRKHGFHHPEGAHAGDILNLVVKPEAETQVELAVPGLSLKSNEKATLFPPAGTSLVIHAAPDDLKSDPAGNSGARIACGVIAR